MDKILVGLLIAGLAVLFVALGTMLAGAFLYLVWPVAVPALLPGLVADGTLADNLTFVQSCFVALFLSIFIRGARSTPSNS